MTKIILHGYLKDLHPNEIKVEANSAAEAVQALSLVPSLKNYGKRHHVRLDGFDSRDAVYDRREIEELHVHPVMTGSGGHSGMGQIIIGVVMIAVAVFAPQLLPGFISAGGFGLAGAMMVLGGVMQMLAPQPSLTSSNDDKSRYLGSGQNTVAIGTRIPMIYGRRKAFGHYLSFDIDAGNLDSAPAAWYASPWTSAGELNNAASPVDLPMGNPQSLYQEPTSSFNGISYPLTMLEEPQTFINFLPPVSLLAGPYDITFATGQTLHVNNPTAGAVTKVTLLGGEIQNLPGAGTSIAFTRNYG